MPVTGLGVAVTTVPYARVVPYSNVTAVLELFAFTSPLSVAPVPDTRVAALVTTVGWIASVVKVKSAP